MLICGVWVCGVLGAGCTTVQQRTQASLYDGDYITSVQHSPATQVVKGLTLDCEPLVEAVFVRVRDGVASGYLHRDENYSFRTRVNTGGRLKAVMPIDSYYRYDEDKPVPLSNLMLIVEADFSNTTRRGAITVGDRRFGFDGCTTTVELIVL